MSPIRSIRAAGAVVVILLAAACGAVDTVTGKSTPSPTPSANGIADKPPAEVVQAAKRAFQDAKFVHVKGNGVEDGVLFAVDMQIKAARARPGARASSP